MSRLHRSSLRARPSGGRLPRRLVAGPAALVVACCGFAAHRSVGAVGDAYRWTGEAEAVTVARVFARSLSARHLREPARLSARQARLIGVHPDLTTVAIEPAGDTHEARYVRQ